MICFDCLFYLPSPDFDDGRLLPLEISDVTTEHEALGCASIAILRRNHVHVIMGKKS